MHSVCASPRAYPDQDLAAEGQSKEPTTETAHRWDLVPRAAAVYSDSGLMSKEEAQPPLLFSLQDYDHALADDRGAPGLLRQVRGEMQRLFAGGSTAQEPHAVQGDEQRCAHVGEDGHPQGSQAKQSKGHEDGLDQQTEGDVLPYNP